MNKTYDYLNRLRAIGSAPSGASPLSYGYTYNNANQRVQVTLVPSSIKSARAFPSSKLYRQLYRELSPE